MNLYDEISDRANEIIKNEPKLNNPIRDDGFAWVQFTALFRALTEKVEELEQKIKGGK